MKMPPMHMIGAATNRVQVISTSICTCWTSLVLRVIRDGGAELADLAVGERADPVEQRGADVTAEAHRRARAEIDRDDRADDLQHRDASMHAAGATGCSRCRPWRCRCR